MSRFFMANRATACLSTMLALQSGFSASAATFGEDSAFLQKHTRLVTIQDASGKGKVAVAPAWQGRVMTSSSAGDSGMSYGWINRELISSGKLQPHINVFGGEDRLWLGPEGGQFSIFFARGAKFELNDWYTPPGVDTMPYEVTKKKSSAVTFRADFAVTNYSGTRFDLKVKREVKMLKPGAISKKLGTKPDKDVSLVAYESVNKLTNTGKHPWSRKTGLLSIWILGMFNPSPGTTIVVPINDGPDSQLGTKVTSDYFGPVPADRLVVKEKAIFFSGDGTFRSKIGVNPLRSKAVLGSYDSANKVLTIVQFKQPEGVTDYVNSMWKIQDKPFSGDAVNSYNDGPPSPGAKPLGPFYELESSSPAAELAPHESITHVHRTFHLTGNEKSLDAIARATLGVSLQEISTALPRH